MTSTIRNAATVLPLRSGNSDGFEVFMVKRNSRLGFHGGAHVFPGGAIDDQDRSVELAKLIVTFDSDEAARILGVEDSAVARGYFVGAARELFEEAGVLLATPAGSATRGAIAGQTYDDERKAVADGSLSFAKFLLNHDFVLDLSGLVHFQHFITPVQEKKRFDTRFFLVRVADDEVAEHDRGETVDGEWISPAAALVRYRDKQMSLLPPTILALERLDACDSIDAALDAAASAEVIEITPRIVFEEDYVALLYPQDPDYHLERIDRETAGRTVARLVMIDGLWCRVV
jgi:8-oxo-dGTP pyrophosphatase MutT (NUDIX family)